MTYEDLLNDLTMEVGGRSDVVSRLPLFVKNIEDALWPRLDGFATVDTESVTITADATEATITATNSDTYWMRVLGVFDEDGNRLERVGMARWQQEVLDGSADELEHFCWVPKSGKIRVAAAPSGAETLTIVVLKRDEPLAIGDDDSKFFLGEGYNLLKYAVLTMRVFDPDKWGAWKQQYDRELHAMFVKSQKLNLTYKGDDGRRWL